MPGLDDEVDHVPVLVVLPPGHVLAVAAAAAVRGAAGPRVLPLPSAEAEGVPGVRADVLPDLVEEVDPELASVPSPVVLELVRPVEVRHPGVARLQPGPAVWETQTISIVIDISHQ